jgi:tripartite-type tricarboxylate transporter receptor subunit TctC
LRAVAVMARQRMAAAPDVPTFAEAGMAEMEVGTWNVVMAPLGTPKPIVDRLNAALNETLRDPGIRDRLTKLGITPVDDSTPASTAETITREIAKWAKAFELAGGKPE